MVVFVLTFEKLLSVAKNCSHLKNSSSLVLKIVMYLFLKEEIFFFFFKYVCQEYHSFHPQVVCLRV